MWSLSKQRGVTAGKIEHVFARTTSAYSVQLSLPYLPHTLLPLIQQQWVCWKLWNSLQPKLVLFQILSYLCPSVCPKTSTRPFSSLIQLQAKKPRQSSFQSRRKTFPGGPATFIKVGFCNPLEETCVSASGKTARLQMPKAPQLTPLQYM